MIALLCFLLIILVLILFIFSMPNTFTRYIIVYVITFVLLLGLHFQSFNALSIIISLILFVIISVIFISIVYYYRKHLFD